MSFFALAALMVSFGGAPDLPRAEPTATVAQVREAVARSLPAVEKGGTRWIEQRDCLSCHNGAFMLWGHAGARDAGIVIDGKKLDKWNELALNFSRPYRLMRPKLDELKKDGVPADVLAKLKPLHEHGFQTEAAFREALGKALTEEEAKTHAAAIIKRVYRPSSPGLGVEEPYQLLLGRGYGKLDASAAAFDELVAVIVKQQLPDGSWKAGGQMPDQRRPRPEGDAAATMWSFLALSTLDKPSENVLKAREKALAFIKKVKPGESNESLLLLMLVEKQVGNAERAQELLAELLKHQNSDGGWAWRHGEASDAFGTGQALYALALMGRGGADREVQRAWRFLLDTQQKDGSWQVPFQAISAKKRPKGGVLQEVYDYWGTTWATIGLSRTLLR